MWESSVGKALIVWSRVESGKYIELHLADQKSQDTAQQAQEPAWSQSVGLYCCQSWYPPCMNNSVGDLILWLSLSTASQLALLHGALTRPCSFIQACRGALVLKAKFGDKIRDYTSHLKFTVHIGCQILGNDKFLTSCTV